MKTALFTPLALLLLAATSQLSEAQVLIDWGSIVGLSTDTDIKTNGTVFDAANSAMNQTFTTTAANGVTFNELLNYAGGTNGRDGTDGYITWHTDGGNFLGNEGFSGGSAAYQYVIDNASDANNGSVTIGTVAHPLTIGVEYQVQAFGYWSGPYAAQLDGSPDQNFPNYGGGYSIGTFTATESTETFTYTGIPGNAGHAGFVNDIVVEALPEPGTWAMMLTGVGALAVLARIRRALAI